MKDSINPTQNRIAAEIARIILRENSFLEPEGNRVLALCDSIAEDMLPSETILEEMASDERDLLVENILHRYPILEAAKIVGEDAEPLVFSLLSKKEWVNTLRYTKESYELFTSKYRDWIMDTDEWGGCFEAYAEFILSHKDEIIETGNVSNGLNGSNPLCELGFDFFLLGQSGVVGDVVSGLGHLNSESLNNIRKKYLAASSDVFSNAFIELNGSEDGLSDFCKIFADALREARFQPNEVTALFQYANLNRKSHLARLLDFFCGFLSELEKEAFASIAVKSKKQPPFSDFVNAALKDYDSLEHRNNSLYFESITGGYESDFRDAIDGYCDFKNALIKNRATLAEKIVAQLKEKFGIAGLETIYSPTAFNRGAGRRLEKFSFNEDFTCAFYNDGNDAFYRFTPAQAEILRALFDFCEVTEGSDGNPKHQTFGVSQDKIRQRLNRDIKDTILRTYFKQKKDSGGFHQAVLDGFLNETSDGAGNYVLAFNPDVIPHWVK